MALMVAVVLLVAPGPSLVRAQARDRATMTVLRGEVAVLPAAGGALQPAPSGTVVQSGDEIRTLSRSGALITFFAGTEIELGDETSLVVEHVAQDGGRVDISLRQVFGASLHRVQSLSDPGSTYQIDVGGAVAVVRGTSFLAYGPTDEQVVGLLCLADCTDQTTFAGCPMAPNLGYWLEVDRGRVVSACQPFRARGSIWNAPGELRLEHR